MGSGCFGCLCSCPKKYINFVNQQDIINKNNHESNGNPVNEVSKNNFINDLKEDKSNDSIKKECQQKDLIQGKQNINSNKNDKNLLSEACLIMKKIESSLNIETDTKIKKSKSVFLSSKVSQFKPKSNITKLTKLCLISKIGLQNIGNTCYMNSALQILIHCVPFVKQFTICEFNKQQVVCQSFLNLINNISNCFYGQAIPPWDLKKTFEMENELYANYSQHDSNEFRLSLLNQINTELNLNNKVTKRQLKQTGDKSKLYQEFIKYHRKIESGIIIDVFYWNDLCTYSCSSCDHKLYVFDQKSDVPIFLQGQHDPHITNLLNKRYSEGKTIDLGEPCVQCKQPNISGQSYRITQLPKVLIISIQRNIGIGYQKNNCLVTFNKVIDALNCTDPDILDSNLSTHYFLFGVVYHTGAMNSGHYFSKILINDKWYEFNDSSVYATKMEYQSSTASCLYYLREEKFCNSTLI